MQTRNRFYLLLARVLIGLVVLFNLQCALVFLIQPGVYAPGFELSGPPGEGIVRGMGILFLMWNVPYVVALWNPLRRVSLFEAVAMQAIGLVGEILIRFSFPPGHDLVQAALGRFILFDAGGLVLLLIAVWCTARKKE
jgi:hypothetical protein